MKRNDHAYVPNTGGSRLLPVCMAASLAVTICSDPSGATEPLTTAIAPSPMVVLSYNDLGMHCMNSDFSEMLILPPFNTVHAQVIRRSESPELITGDVAVRYFIPGHTRGADRSNFWTFAPAALGPPSPDVGVTGSRLAGLMTPTGQNDWSVTGIPLVPTDDTGRENAYPLATIEVTANSVVRARTQTVLPVSTEMSCNLCHNTPNISIALDILQKHDLLHGTSLMDERPVLCAACHSDNALGAPGQPGVSSLSAAMHSSHAQRVEVLPIAQACYACHPGIRTNCQRDVHFTKGIGCTDCHGNMAAVGAPNREPWLDEPRCATCHQRPGFRFEQLGTLYRNSVGHGEVHCWACHGSPHAITPAATEKDNVQAMRLQGHAGVIDTCTVCHTRTPDDPFPHRRDD